MFVDKVSVLVSAGRGGNGAVSFRHEKYVDKGGPDGGDGGKGGDVVLVGSTRTNTLASFRYQKELQAKDGSPGSKRKKHGKSAADLEVQVPIGTAVYNEAGQLLADITDEGQKATIARGGRGGFGNAHFTSSRRQTPRVAEKGEPGEAYVATFELKIIAEVGLIGLPNAGKSTLLARVTNAKPEIANYPFTTIKPNLGVAEISKERSLLIADIPGLIEGASQGKGLGDDFLRHIERTRVLIHLVDAYSEDVAADYAVIRAELGAYSIDLLSRPEIVTLTKVEGLDEEIIKDQLSRLKPKLKKNTPLIAISSQSGHGLKELLFEAVKLADKEAQKVAKTEPETVPILTLTEEQDDDGWQVIKTAAGGYQVTGKKIERFASQTDFENYAGVDRLRDIMRKMGIMHELERQNINAGDEIRVGINPEHGRFEY